jgi:hypothetical protein
MAKENVETQNGAVTHSSSPSQVAEAEEENEKGNVKKMLYIDTAETDK